MRYLLLLQIFLTQLCHGQKYDNDSLFNIFKKDIQIELARRGCINWDDETKESYYTLMINCPIEDLFKYTDDSISAIRCSIFTGLAQKNAGKDILTGIISKHKNDTAEYINCPTDVVITWNVFEYMQKVMEWKMDRKTHNTDYVSLLKTVRSRFRLNVPGEYHGVISKDNLLKVDSLTYSRKGFRIISFSLENGVESIAMNNLFTDRIKEFIKNTKSGDKLVINEIIIEATDKSRRKLPYQVLEIQ
ncbi:MAG: hypothetical protein V4722_26600 [Bacteroidota bacterium]